MLNIKLCFTDTETGGLDASKNALLQFAGDICYLNDKSLVTKINFNYYMKPFENDIITDDALRVNNILKEDISKFHDPHEVYDDFTNKLDTVCNKYDKTDKLFFVAYNAKFDYDFVRAWFEKNGDKYMGGYFWFPMIDVMQIASYYLMLERHKIKNFKLATVAEYLGITADGDLHDAKTDNELTKKMFMYFYNKNIIKI